MSTIRDTVIENLNRQGMGTYARQAEPIITVLVERERDIASQIVDAAQQAGVGPREVAETLTRLGMEQPRGYMGVASAPQTGSSMRAGDTSTEALLQRIDQNLSNLYNQVQGLATFARQNGYNG